MAGGLNQSIHRTLKCAVGGYGVGPKHVMRTAHKAVASQNRSKAEAATNKAAKTIAAKIAAGVTRR